MLIDVALSGDRNMIKKEAEKIIKYKQLLIEIQHMWDVKTNNRGNWNHLKITQTILEQHTGKARSLVTTTHSHIGHCTHKCGKF